MSSPGDEMPTFIASQSISRTYHAIGPSLALEAMLGQRGPVGLALYAQSQVYWILSNRDNTVKWSG